MISVELFRFIIDLKDFFLVSVLVYALSEVLNHSFLGTSPSLSHLKMNYVQYY